jgi:hypothetical protein
MGSPEGRGTEYQRIRSKGMKVGTEKSREEKVGVKKRERG